ncbi:MAG: DEAD/DEAH box helicase family protein [Candidatus Lokiarchaeota archaeon]|nr:DEAD/DEAH box helicase family protein [Candidatus Lokiarchaeota archaeon]
MIEPEKSNNHAKKMSYLREKHIEQRGYQLKIAKECVSKNSLVVLPTGLGKTIIGVFVAAGTLESFPPKSKIVVLAPTRPLINQHYDSFKDLMTIPKEQFIVLTGKIVPEKRVELFHENQIIFYTPQTLRNDLVNRKYSLESVCLIIFDEAHHATGDYAYTLIADEFVDQNPDGTILGLTASPGSTKEKIKILCENLHIPLENIHTRTRKDVDVKTYLKPMDVYKIGVNLTELMGDAYLAVQTLLEERLQYLSQLGFLSVRADNLYTKVIRKDLIKLNSELVRLVKGDGDKTGVYSSLSVNAQALILFHMLELIEQQGLDVLLIYLTKVKQDARKKTSSKAVKILASDHRINQIYIELKKNEDLSPEQLIHPKFYVLEKLLLQEITSNPNSRVLVFVKLRDSVRNIVNRLKTSNSEVLKPARFVGQATKSKDDKGLSQKKQLEILGQFKQGEYNILVSTNVGEEGLDIAECDLVIFYDVVASEIRFIQRKGRTARHREGKVIILYCKDTHDEIYMRIALNKLNKMNINLKSSQQLRSSYTKAPKEIRFEEEMIAEDNSLVKIHSEPTIKVGGRQKQGTLQAFLQNPSNSSEIKDNIVEIKISQSLPVKFGIRKNLQRDQIPFEIVKSIIHITLFDRVIIQSLDPHQFEEESLLTKISHLSKKYSLIVSIFDFVNFSERFQDEERLLKKKIKDWGLKNDLQAIPIDLPEELYFIVKNIYLHSKKELGVA